MRGGRHFTWSASSAIFARALRGRRIGRRAVRTAFAAAAFLTTKSTLDDKVAPSGIETYRPPRDYAEVPISRKIVNPADNSGLNLRLYQYQSCPFCCKVRAFLDYYGFSYEVVEVNPVTKTQMSFSKDYKKVPVITSNEITFKESSLIISQLTTYLKRPNRNLHEIGEMYPSIETVRDDGKLVKICPNKYFIMNEDLKAADLASEREERKWREWVDDHFIHLISPNIYRNLAESFETFEWFSKYGEWNDNFSTWSRLLAKYMGAFIMWIIAKRLKKRHNITDERQALKNAFDEWMNAIGSNRTFLGGDKPNLADLVGYSLSST
ncbi:Prostaglandin E synthase 2 [Trichostrongylus colubriformis]|uniref:Prostaglandin E synthase 2 n=1 Tax=Trichostrongylus colubriformis TaxID=6319 RepID=A0AAN8EUG2_TRICO